MPATHKVRGRGAPSQALEFVVFVKRGGAAVKPRPAATLIVKPLRRIKTNQKSGSAALQTKMNESGAESLPPVFSLLRVSSLCSALHVPSPKGPRTSL